MEENTKIRNDKSIQADEIDLMELFKKIWTERILIYKVTGVFFLLGLIIAFGTPKQYKAEITLLVETSGGSSMNGLLQQFGGIAGLNLSAGQGGDFLSPEIYPQIIQSTPFLVEIMGENIQHSPSDSAITVFKYLSTTVTPSVLGILKSYTLGLPWKIIALFKKKELPDYTLPDLKVEPIDLSKEQSVILMEIKERIKIKTDDLNGTVNISTEMPSPTSAAGLTSAVYKYLSKYLIEYKIQKVKTDLDFITQQHENAKKRYVETQQQLAIYRDANRNVLLATSRTEEERLVNEFTLAFNVYNSLSQQLEQAKLKVQEKTPGLKVIDPVKIPLFKCKPNRSLILGSTLFLGGFLGIVIIFVKMLLHKTNI